jgi:hypothetical protein
MSRTDLLIELKAQVTRREYKELGLVNLGYLVLEIDRELSKLGKSIRRVGRPMVRTKW